MVSVTIAVVNQLDCVLVWEVGAVKQDEDNGSRCCYFSLCTSQSASKSASSWLSEDVGKTPEHRPLSNTTVPYSFLKRSVPLQHIPVEISQSTNEKYLNKLS